MGKDILENKLAILLGKFEIQIVQSTDNTFIDDLTCKTDYEILKYYTLAYNENSEMLGLSIKYEDLILIEKTETLETTEKNKVLTHNEN